MNLMSTGRHFLVIAALAFLAAGATLSLCAFAFVCADECCEGVCPGSSNACSIGRGSSERNAIISFETGPTAAVTVTSATFFDRFSHSSVAPSPAPATTAAPRPLYILNGSFLI